MCCGKNTNNSVPWKLQELEGGAHVAPVKECVTTFENPDSSLDQSWWVSAECVICDVKSGLV